MTWRRRAALFAGALVAYLAFLVGTFPAAVLLPHLIPPYVRIDLQGVEGSIWSGSVHSFWASQASLGTLRWNLVTWRLLLGEVALDVDLEGENGRASGRVAATFGGRMHAEDLALDFDAELLHGMWVVPFVLRGRVQGRVERLDWVPGQLPLVAGNLTWKGAGLEVPRPIDLGEVRIRATTDGTKGTITWGGTPGALATEGQVNLTLPVDYSLRLSLKPQGTLDSGTQAALGLLGRPGPDGAYRVSFAGRIKPLPVPPSS
jgi:general secretion pathway protein N